MEQTPPVAARYELANTHELPFVDLTRSIKSTILTTKGLQRFNSVMTRLNRLMTLLYSASFPAEVALLVVHESTGKWLALIKVVGQLPLLLQGFTALRVDILRCLLWTYEFWFLSGTNALNSAMFLIYFGDARAVVALIFWLGAQLNICVDANLQIHQLVSTSLIAVLQLVWILISVVLQLTPGTCLVVLLEYDGHAMSNNDVMISTVSIMLIYMVRTVYRKY